SYRTHATAPLNSFPTRRSYDLGNDNTLRIVFVPLTSAHVLFECVQLAVRKPILPATPRMMYEVAMDERLPDATPKRVDAAAFLRSEEHTSELQSRENLVFRHLV